MHPDSIAAIIINDLGSLEHRIEALPAHPRYTDALLQVAAAKRSVGFGRQEIHAAEMETRHGKGTALADGPSSDPDAPITR